MPCATGSRRSFLLTALGAWTSAPRRAPAAEGRLLGGLSTSILFPGRKTGRTWFHPRACAIPLGGRVAVLMTLQTISGSDVFGPVHWTLSRDHGATWSVPEAIPGLGRRDLGERWEEGVCDVVPEYHARTNTVLAIGHNVYYHKGVLARPQRQRWPVYTVRTADGRWHKPRKLDWNDPRGTLIATCGCAQRVTLDNGDLLIPLSFGAREGQPRSVTTILCSFDGKQLTVRKTGNALPGRVARGLLEPSLTRLDGRFWMTIRAEDGRGHVSTSRDGLQWDAPRAWAWDDGTPIDMSTTQQRWLVHSDDLFLVYTRKDASNAQVTRWRAPLYVARVDRKRLRLVRDSERVVFPLRGDAVKAPRHVALMGNFHTTAVTPDESWVSVGENRPRDGWAGDTLLARIRWKRPNRLALAVK